MCLGTCWAHTSLLQPRSSYRGLGPALPPGALKPYYGAWTTTSW
jgi:hypothetical protein